MPLTAFASDARVWVIRAQQLADERHSAEVTLVHLLAAALECDAGVVEVVRRAGADPSELLLACETALRALPRSDGPAFLSGELQELIHRVQVPSRLAGAKPSHRVEVEDLLIALCDAPAKDIRRVLGRFQLGPGSLRSFLPALRSVPRSLAPRQESSRLGPWLSGLSELARRGELEAVVGREREIRQVLVTLARKEQSSALLVGEEGVGRRAIVRGVVLHAAQRPGLGELRFLELDVDQFLGSVRSRVEARIAFERLLERLDASASTTVLVLASAHRLWDSDGGGPMLLQPLLSAMVRHQLRLLMTTTPAEVRSLVAEQGSMTHHFTVLQIEPPSSDLAQQVVVAAAARLAAHHRVVIPDSAAVLATTLAARFLAAQQLPRSAIDVLDRAAAALRLESNTEGPTLTSGAVADEVATMSGVPSTRLLERETDKLQNMDARLAARVVGQGPAVAAVCRAIRRSRVGLRDAGRPIGSFLFLGTSGVGKTELAKALAELLFDDEQALTRLDMSEFMERHMAQRLIGAPPGYAGSDAGGFLTEAVRRRPYSVLLFDEVEKAHQDVFNLLLQVLDDGRLTDGRGRTVDFTHCVVIMTSNLGAEVIAAHGDAQTDELGEPLQQELRAFFRPEFLNRIGDVVVFRPLTRRDLEAIFELQLARVRRMLAPSGLGLEVEPAAKARLVAEGYEPARGARPLQRVLIRRVQDPLATALLSGAYASGATLTLAEVDGQLQFRATEPPTG